ncbi:MAG: glycosyltransferase family A protein [Actinomycetota bacterium]|nr:glycosyltransferase family A protein [Actinomycetota bacterium]
MGQDSAISVVVTCYNGAATIAETINSILDQRSEPLEIIAVDDGSTDASVEILQGYGDEIRLIVRENGGPSRARNTGIAAAQGSWICFCDGDDLWHPDKLSRQIEASHKNPEIKIFATSWRRRSEELSSDDTGNHIVKRTDLIRLNQFQTSTVMIEASIFQEVGGFDPNVDVAEDWEMWIRACQLSDVLIDESPLVMYRDSPKGVSKDLTTLFEKCTSVMANAYDSGGLSLNQRDELLAWHRQRILIGQILTKNIGPAIKMTAETLRDSGPTNNAKALLRYTIPFLRSRAKK